VNPDHRVHRETSDIDLGSVLRFAIGLVAAGVVIHVLVWVPLRALQARSRGQMPAEFRSQRRRCAGCS